MEQGNFKTSKVNVGIGIFRSPIFSKVASICSGSNFQLPNKCDDNNTVSKFNYYSTFVTVLSQWLI